jgi:O-antigen/teichoic acid export membrane protein
MFNLKYNFLSLTQVLVGLLNYFLLIKLFGVSNMADSYLITSAIISSFLLLQMLTTEQFIFFYNDIKDKNILEAHDFYNVVLSVALFTGIITFILCYFGVNIVVNIFVGNLENERLLLIQQLLQISIVELLVAPMQLINQKLMNAEMKFSIPYILNILPTVFVLFSMIYLYVYKLEDISLLIYGRVAGALVILPLSFVIIQKMNIPIKFSFKHSKLNYFLKNSFTMRLGHNIHNFLFTPITTNILAMLPVGYAAYFFYALRMSNIVNGVIVGPSYNVFQSKFSQAWSKYDIKNSKRMIFQYLMITLPMIVIVSIIGYYILPHTLHIITAELSNESLSIIQNVFLGLMIWQLIILVESGNVIVLIVEKKSTIFILTNIVFSIIYFIVSKFLFEYFSIYSLVYGLILGQLINYIVYTYYGKVTLNNKERKYDS